MDEMQRAFAILHLPSDAKPEAIRTRYKELVRQWHPDRFANDPKGVEEATTKLRVVNAAYATILRRRFQRNEVGCDIRDTERDSPILSGSPLTDAHIEEISKAILESRGGLLQIRDDPINRLAALAVTTINLVAAVAYAWTAKSPFGRPSAPAASLAISWCCLKLIWSDVRVERAIGWLVLIALEVLLPTFVALA